MLKKTFISLVLFVCTRTYAAETRLPPQPGPLQPGRVIDTVRCSADPSQSYALYIPAKGAAGNLPVLYLFDPHGAGALPVTKYRSLADAYGFILVGSNNSKNGNDWSTTENIWRCLFEDTKTRLKIRGDRIYTGGFSGGAKVAGFVAIQHPEIKGVIANGAGLPDGVQAENFPFSFTAITGEGDMNMTELVGISHELDRTRTRHRILFFAGKHEWAPEATMNTAFAGLQFDAMIQGALPKDEVFINRYVEKSKGRLSDYISANLLLKAEEECNVPISFLDGLTTQVNWFRDKVVSIVKNPLYRTQRLTQLHLLDQEQRMKAEYMQHFQQTDDHYWPLTILDLKEKAFLSKKPGEAAMHQRLLAYLSLAFYSLSNRAISSNANAEARNFVELYKKVDPTNSEAWYFSAILNARAMQTQAAENDLLKAVKCGFRDKDRLRQQPEFRQLKLDRIEHLIWMH